MKASIIHLRSGIMNVDANVSEDLGGMLVRARRNTLGDLLTRTRDRMPEKSLLLTMGSG